MITKIVLNEQHALFPEQEKLLEKYVDAEKIYVPAKGWTLEEMMEIAEDMRYDEYTVIIFISPIPVLLGLCAGIAARDYTTVYVMHNDKREKKKLPNGKIIQTVAKEGWKLVQVA